MFGISQQLGLAVELDTLCQRRAIQGGARLEGGHKLFVTALPATLLAGEGEACLLEEWMTQAGLNPWYFSYWLRIQAITSALVPMSGAGMSMSGPIMS